MTGAFLLLFFQVLPETETRKLVPPRWDLHTGDTLNSAKMGVMPSTPNSNAVIIVIRDKYVIILTHSRKSNLKQKKEESSMSLHSKATKPNFNVVGAAVFGGNCRSQNARWTI